MAAHRMLLHEDAVHVPPDSSARLGYNLRLQTMPWKCPACSEQIRHAPGEDTPRQGAIYRCHICRLELMLDAEAGKLTLAPFPPDTAADRPPRRSNR
jgi:hypothetical protein